MTFLSHFNLPKTTLKVYAGKMLSSHHRLHLLLHTGKGINVLLSTFVQPVEVNTE